MKVEKYLRVNAVLLIVARLGPIQAAALPAGTPNVGEAILLDGDTYSFEQFLSDFGRFYHDKNEYLERESIFYENLQNIILHNRNQQAQRTVKTSAGQYWMGINPWADRRANELFRGYDKYQSTIVRLTSSIEISSEQRQLRHYSQRDAIDEDTSKTFLEKYGHSIDFIEDLPKSVDWRLKGVTTPVKSQGMCGSCWAFASTAVLESHIAIQTGILYDLSPQQLVSCAPNPYHCGGNGGCNGATAELAFDLVQELGIVQEWQFGYQDSEGAPINCTLTRSRTNSDGKTYFHGAVAGITEYVTLPSNNYTILMNTVAKVGPVAVSVACLPWHLYQSGIFYQPMKTNSSATTDLNHLVVLEGYGFDEETGEEYWIVRNSWGPRWGEHGYIRLKRVGESECGWDTTPDDGISCTLDPDGNAIIPLPQHICGNSGILFDSAIPLGCHLI
jgi:cathepsin L